MFDTDFIDVRAIREALGWTQHQLAAECDVNRATVSKWETEPPARGPARILLKQLRQRAIDAADAGDDHDVARWADDGGACCEQVPA